MHSNKQFHALFTYIDTMEGVENKASMSPSHIIYELASPTSPW